jgi:LysR family transcriptional regulator of gallate degradation
MIVEPIAGHATTVTKKAARSIRSSNVTQDSGRRQPGLADVEAMNIRHMAAVVTLARVGDMHSTALLFGVKQPSITQALAKLEARVGGRLFLRNAAGCVPTEAGKRFLSRAERALIAFVGHLRQMPGSPFRDTVGLPARLPSMTKLQVFLGTIRCDGFAFAARQMGISRSATLRAIRELEDFLGAPLFVREGGRFDVHPHATAFAYAAGLLIEELRIGVGEARDVMNVRKERLVIGASDFLQGQLISRSLKCLTLDQGDEIIVRSGSSAELIAALETGSIDLVIAARSEGLSNISSRRLFDDHPVVVCRKDHPAVHRRLASVADLEEYPWIICLPDAARGTQWKSIFERDRLLPTHIVCDSARLAHALLLEGEWVAIMSQDQLRAASGSLVAIGAPLESLSHEIVLMTRSNGRPSSLHADFVAALDQVVAAAGTA